MAELPDLPEGRFSHDEAHKELVALLLQCQIVG